MNSFFYTCPTKSFKFFLKIWMYPGEVRRFLRPPLEARRGEYYAHESEEENEEESKEEPIINTDKSFKSDECVMCLINPPNVLFCNCGHLCICVECDKTKRLKNCPICKTETTSKRTI